MKSSSIFIRVENLKREINKLWNNHPLRLILFIAFALRLIAVIFSKGFGMHDDHFLVIEAAQSWVDGYDYNNWLPWSPGNAGPSGHSFFYVGIHYLLLYLMKLVGIFQPEVKMFIIRLLHALFSLLTVYFSFKITYKLTDKKTARLVALLIATLWFQPWLSVRNLVEAVCIPFLMMGTWMLLNIEGRKRLLLFVFSAGVISGMAISIRFQSLFFVGGMGLVLLLQRKWLQTLSFGLGVIVIFILIQAPVDYYLWGKPFTELTEYVRYNFANKYEYFVSPWYTYALVIVGMIIPPISLFVFWGYLKSFKKHLLIFLPSFVFIILHSYFPNKQERFIFPVIPFIVMGGIIGMQEIKKKKKLQRLLKRSWTFFWIINFILLSFVTFHYSKKSRVESMLFLSKFDYFNQILIEDSNNNSTIYPPLFYCRQWPNVYVVNNKTSREPCVNPFPAEKQPAFVFFYEDNNLAHRLGRMKTILPHLTYEARFVPGFIDQLLFILNPINRNQSIYVFRNKDVEINLR